MYCSYFTYGQHGNSIRQRFATQNTAPFIQKITHLEQQRMMPAESTLLITKFLDADDNEQRDILDKPENKRGAQNVIRVLATFVEKSSADKEFLMYALALLDGILEDKRSRVKHYVSLIDEFRTPINIIKVMNGFIASRQEPDFCPHRDIAAHIAALVIEAVNFERVPETLSQS